MLGGAEADTAEHEEAIRLIPSGHRAAGRYQRILNQQNGAHRSRHGNETMLNSPRMADLRSGGARSCTADEEVTKREEVARPAKKTRFISSTSLPLTTIPNFASFENRNNSQCAGLIV